MDTWALEENKFNCEISGSHCESMKMTACWDIARRSLVAVNLSFRGGNCLYHQGDRSDDGDSTQLWNVGLLQRDYTALTEISS
jgi:hypothetical protein